MKEPVIAGRTVITNCPDGHVVIILRDISGADIAQAHMSAEIALAIASDLQREAIAIASKCAGHA